MLSKTGTTSRISFALAIIILTLLMLTLTWNYGHIQINNLNVVNMYFSIQRYELKNKTSKAHADVKNKNDPYIDAERETVGANTKEISNILPPLDEKVSETHSQTQRRTKQHISKTSIFVHEIHDDQDSVHIQNNSANSKLSSKSRLDDIHLHIVNTSAESANLTGYKLPDKNDENETVLDEFSAKINETNRISPTDKCVQRLPDCIIIGVQKCGTKALAEFLKTHPNVSLDSRQTYFFSQNYDKGLQWYRNQMPCSGRHQLVLERTPQYFYYKEVPGRIYDMNKQIKLILIVCDPVTRAISNFAMAKDRDRENDHEQFEDCVLGNDGQVNSSCKYVRKSHYQKFMIHWLNGFPLAQIHIVNGKMLRDDPATELQEVEKFLGVPAYIQKEHFVLNPKTGFKCMQKQSSEKPECLSRKKGRKHPSIKDSVVSLLEGYFRPRNEKFFKMIGQKFNW